MSKINKQKQGIRRKNILDYETISPLIKMQDIPFDEAVKVFLQDCSIRNLSEYTVNWYRDKLKLFLMRLDKDIKSPDGIKVNHIKEFILKYRRDRPGGEERADSSINGVLRAVRSFLNYCYNEGLISENVGAKVKTIKEREKIVQTFSKEQVRELMKQPDLKTFTGLRDFTILMLLVDVGIRVSELVKICIHDVSWREKLITVNGKGGKQRQLPLHLSTITQLQKYYRIRGELKTRAFFVTVDNDPISVRQVQEQIKKYGRMAKITGIRVSPHTIRHTFAKFWIKNGGDPFTLQKILGHTDLTMTRRYVNMFSADLQEAHKKFSPIDRIF